MSSKLSPVSSPPPSCCSGGGGVGLGVNYIEHQVSKMDTLAGIAIKYGVEVADIKRINGLVTDLQMFALKSLYIPLPGRHPPSPIMSNGIDAAGPSSTEQTSPSQRHINFIESFQTLKLNSSSQRKVSQAMSNLQRHYGLSTDKETASEELEMAVLRKGSAHYLEDGPFAERSPLFNSPLNSHGKFKSSVNRFLSENGKMANDGSVAEATDGNSDNWNDKSFRRCQKSDADFTSRTPEMLLKDDNSSGGSFLAINGKGLALRPKTANRTALGSDAEGGSSNPIPAAVGNFLVNDHLNGVRKSSSTSSLQDKDTSTASIWPTSKWSLKTDFQVLSAAAMKRPIFDGFPSAITGRRNKAALD
ncbi:uncharacterized protein LOC132303268 [Cornus florida]|uniref:uncharacterized protein LOC132303268 n=1 Tax=Cornus florida TaxID=4283 RepID=UPI002898683B|nr:uncharacterized protein LOC132303268 [Cornus florida]